LVTQVQIGVTCAEDTEHPGHLLISKTDENVDQVKEHDFKNRGIIMCEVASMLGILFRSLSSILTENLNVHHIATKFMPRTYSVWFVYASNARKNNCCSTPFIHTKFSAISLPSFPKTQDGFKGKKI
jgi:hypothetical protein